MSYYPGDPDPDEDIKTILFIVFIAAVLIMLTACGHQPPGQDLWLTVK